MSKLPAMAAFDLLEAIRHELGLDSANATIVDGVSAINSGNITLHGAIASALDFSAVESYDDVAIVVEGALRKPPRRTWTR